MAKRDAARITLTLLGGFQARAGGATVGLPTRKAQALLAYLALRPGQVHGREKLATLLWGDTTEDRARNSLRQTVFALRRAFAPLNPNALIAEGESLSLDPGTIDVDVVAFECLVSEGTLEALGKAAAIYKGDFLDGLNLKETTFDEWLLSERERIRELAVEVLARLLASQAKSGATDAGIQTAVRLLALDPLQESVHRTLMRLYALQGRRGAALKQYQACVEILERELGVQPEARTTQLHAQILESRSLDTGPVDPIVVRRVPKRGPEGCAVLVVEDEPTTQTLVEKYLVDAGYQVVIAGDGAQALRQLGDRKFDIVLSDIQMPTLDGLKLLETMSEKGIETPAIFLTGQVGTESEVKGLKLGAADYIRKPVQKEILLLRLKNVLNR